MTQTTYTRPLQPASAADQNANGSGFNLKRIVIIATAVLVGLVLLIFILGLLLSRGDVNTLGPVIQVARDLVIIFLALEGIMIILALAVLIFQVARLINLLQTEVKPALTDTRQTLQSAKGTVEFVGDTVSGPIIKASAFFAGVGSLVGNVGGIRKAIKRTAEDVAEDVKDVANG
jgi:heme/copper-type cytochrome/quinol oxidase subunit 2